MNIYSTYIDISVRMASEESIEGVDGDEETKAKKVCLPEDITISKTMSSLTADVRIKKNIKSLLSLLSSPYYICYLSTQVSMERDD